MILLLATACAGTFFGAALFVNLVEHPARVEGGTELAVREFGPSYRRAALMQGSLAVGGSLAGLVSSWQQQDLAVAAAAVLLGLVVPFTMVVISPTNERLLDPSLDAASPRAAELLARWGRLHAVRTSLSALAFGLFLLRLGSSGGP
jgi:hypothetical protein